MPERQDAEHQLRDEVKRLRLMIDGSRDYISLIDRDYVYRAVNRAYLQARDVMASDMIGMSVRSVWGNDVFRSVIKGHLDRCFRGETVQHRASFEFRGAQGCHMDVTYYPCENNDGEVTHAVVVNHDITELVRKEEKLSRLAYYDVLTALPNRAQFLERLTLGIANARRVGESLAVFFIDLDNFKKVNDVHGHAAGDDLLRLVAARLYSGFRETDTVGQPVGWYRGDDASINRLGGDEFTLVFPGVKHLRALTILAQRVNDLFADPFSVVDNDLHVTCSVGISVFPNDGTDGETLVKHADIAMYRAKESGKNSFAFYNPSMSEQLKNATEIEGRLRKAIGAGKIEVHYQPKVDAGGNCVVGCEALARWHDPVLGQIPPSRFIPVAEEAGLIRELDLSILERACEDLGRLHAGGLMLSVSVNFSNHHFEQDDIVERTLEILERTGYPKHLLEIEITESAMIGDVDCAIAKLEQLRKHGIGVALDDFGTGFSSLTYLSRLPIDVLKIDRTFITRLDCHNESAVLEGIMMIAHRLGQTVVAEGVETAAQLERLRCFGEPVVQGYLFSRPLAPADFAAYLEDFERGGGRVVRKAGRWPMLAHAAT